MTTRGRALSLDGPRARRLVVDTHRSARGATRAPRDAPLPVLSPTRTGPHRAGVTTRTP